MHDYVASTGIRESKYKKVLGILKELNRIDPEYMPGEVLEELERFKRPEQGGGALAKVRGLNEWGVSMATGRRKTSVSRVKVVEGNGEVLVNGKTLDEAFSRKHDRESVIWPMRVTGRMDKYNIWAECTGGGTTGQAEAIALGVSKALMIHEPLLKPVLRRGLFFGLFGWGRILMRVQRVLLREILVWSRGRSQVTSRRGRCLPVRSPCSSRQRGLVPEYLLMGSAGVKR